jgi:phosphoglycolate phosphatase
MPPLPIPEVVACVGEGAITLIERVTPGRSAEERVTALAAFRAFYNAHCTVHTVLYPGVIEMLDALRRHGWLLAVATNKPLVPTRLILEHTGLLPRLAGVRGGDGPKKPDPTQLDELFAETGSRPADGWMIGDHFTDLAAAKAAGCRSILCRWGFGEPRGLTADGVADHPADVARIIIAQAGHAHP